ncbi:MAG: hypothetical protein ACE5FL_02295 [Myxococcota bacterium]
MSVSARALVESLAGHSVAALGIDPEDVGDSGRWFVAALLLNASRSETAACDAARALAREALGAPHELAAADAERVAALLSATKVPKPEVAARVLLRACGALVERWDGSFTALAGDADDLETLGGRIAKLAPGVGRAAVTRFLRPLRGAWSAAAEIPLTPAALAAGICIGWLPDGVDDDGSANALRGALAAQDDPPRPSDVEAALERLGARACLRGRADRCPLRDRCPRRARDVALGGPRE